MAFLLTASSAHAFVCARVQDSSGDETGASLSWYTRELHYALHSAGTSDIAGSNEHDALRGAFDAWLVAAATPSGSCPSAASGTDLTFTEDGLVSIDRIGYNYLDPEDNENLLIFRDAVWPHSNTPDGIIALTTTTFVPLTGELVDADIELNSRDIEFGLQGESNRYDLVGAAVHEIGHFVGLGHSSVPGATMQPRAVPGDLSLRTPECDDIAAVVFKYPFGAANGYCATISAQCGYCAPPGTVNGVPSIAVGDRDDGEGGCRATSATGWAEVVGLLALVVGRRKGRSQKA